MIANADQCSQQESQRAVVSRPWYQRYVKAKLEKTGSGGKGGLQFWQPAMCQKQAMACLAMANAVSLNHMPCLNRLTH